MRRNERGGPVAHGPASEKIGRHQATEPQSQPNAADRQKLPRVAAYAAEPAGRRSMWAIVVPHCARCGHLHLHRSTGQHGGIRTGSCGAEYVVVLTEPKLAQQAAEHQARAAELTAQLDAALARLTPAERAALGVSEPFDPNGSKPGRWAVIDGGGDGG